MRKDTYYYDHKAYVENALKEEMRTRGERYYNKKKRTDTIELIVCTVLGIAVMVLLMAITTN